MEEMNINDEIIKSCDFSSVVVVGEKENRELNNVTWAKLAVIWRMLLILFCALMAFCITLPELKDLFPMAVLVLVFNGCMYLITRKEIKRAYQRILLSSGGSSVVYKVFFGEKITVETDKHAPVEYDYNTITSIKETGSLYLLALKYNLYILVQKEPENHTGKAGFLEYIFEKSTGVKKKKVKKIMNKERENVIYLCCFAAIFIVELISLFF